MYYRDRNMVFVHVPKTAGQSIEQFFLNDAGLGWDDRAQMLMGPNEDPSKGPKRLAHLLARDYVGCGHLSQPEFDACFSFGFVRHPMARAISMYKYNRAFNRMSFHDYLTIFLPERIAGDNWFHRPQADFLCDDTGNVMVDFVGRFEQLEADFAVVCNRLDLKFETLEHVNQSLVSDHQLADNSISLLRRFRRFLRRLKPRPPKVVWPVPAMDEAMADPDLRRAIQAVYAQDFEVFGYATQ